MHLVESKEAQKALDDACLRFRNAAIAWEDLTWAIMKDHTLGTAVSDDGLCRVVVDQGVYSIERPTIEMVFRINGREIEIIAVRFLPAVATTSGRA